MYVDSLTLVGLAAFIAFAILVLVLQHRDRRLEDCED